MVDYLPCSRFKVCRILCLSIALSGFFLSFSCCLVGDNDAIFLPFRWIRLNPFKRNWDGNVVVFLLSLSSLSLFFLIFLFFYPWSNVSLMFIDLLAAASALEMLCNLWVFRGSSFLVLISKMNAHLGGVVFGFFQNDDIIISAAYAVRGMVVNVTWICRCTWTSRDSFRARFF